MKKPCSACAKRREALKRAALKLVQTVKGKSNVS